MPKKGFLINTRAWRSDIEVHVLPAEPSTSYSFKTRDEMKTKVRDRMLEVYGAKQKD
jgi:hypothetical protein